MVWKIFLFIFLEIINTIRTFSVGLDFGNELFKGAYIIPGKGFNFIEDHMASRTSANLVSFCKEKLFFEYQGLKRYKKKNCESFYYLNRFFDSRENILEKKEISKKIFKDTFEINHDEFGPIFLLSEKEFPKKIIKRKKQKADKITIRHEEIIALILKNIKINAKRSSGYKIKNIVQTIWKNNLSIIQRKRLLASYLLANLTPISFIHENTAALVYFTFDKKYEENYKENILIINIGALATKISFFKIETISEKKNKRKFNWPVIEEIHDLYSEDFSGIQLDNCLSDYALETFFKNKNEKIENTDIYKNRNLLTEIKSVKKKLSVNKNAYFQIIDFFGETSLKVTLKKKDFEKRCSKIFSNLDIIFKKFEKELKKIEKDTKIDQIQIIGGLVRVPEVQKKIKEFYKMEILSNINGDHGPALGASLIAANITSSLRQKRIFLKRKIYSNIEFKLNFEEKDNNKDNFKNGILFEKGCNLDKKKIVNFKNIRTDFKVTLSENGVVFEKYMVMGITEFFNENQHRNFTNYKTLLNFELDNLGIVNLRETELVLNELVETKEKEETKIKPKTVKERLKIIKILDENKTILDDNEKIKESLKILEELDNYEKLKKEFSKKKNKLESLIYKIKELLEDEKYSEFIKNSEKENILKIVKQEEENFFSSIDNLIITDLIEKIHILENSIKPIKKRKEEFLKRKDFIKKIIQELDNKISYLKIYKSGMYWINSFKFEELLNQVKIFKNEFLFLVEKQNKKKLNEDPLFYIQDIEIKKNDLFKRMRKVFSIRRFTKIDNIKKNVKHFWKKVKDYDYNTSLENMGKKIMKNLGLDDQIEKK